MGELVSALWQQLTPEEQNTYHKDYIIYAVGSRSGKTYRIYAEHKYANIMIPDNPSIAYCAYPSGLPPGLACALIQKLMIEKAEDQFLEVARPHKTIQPIW